MLRGSAHLDRTYNTLAVRPLGRSRRSIRTMTANRRVALASRQAYPPTGPRAYPLSNLFRPAPGRPVYSEVRSPVICATPSIVLRGLSRALHQAHCHCVVRRIDTCKFLFSTLLQPATTIPQIFLRSLSPELPTPVQRRPPNSQRDFSHPEIDCRI